MTEIISRRTLIYGSAGAALLAACGGGGGGQGSDAGAPEPKGPVINKQDAGTQVTPADQLALVESLDAALKSGDPQAVLALLGEVGEESVWVNRARSAGKLPYALSAVFLDKAYDRTVNSAGGAVEYKTTLVYAHQLAGCDAQPTGLPYFVDIRKESPEAPLKITRTLVANEDGPYPTLWDISDVDYLETDDTLLVFRPADAARAKANLDRIDAGVRQGKELITPAEGVEKVFVALGWPAVKKTLFGGSGLPEALGTATRMSFIEPQLMADGGVDPGAALKNGPLAGCRIVLHDDLFRGGQDVQAVTYHEAVHSLAYKWGVGAPSWAAEGLATWAEEGGAAGVRSRTGGQVAAQFPAFARRAVTKDFDFYQGDVTANYTCASAIYAAVEQDDGVKGVLALAEAAYRSERDDKAFQKASGTSFEKLLARTATWARA